MNGPKIIREKPPTAMANRAAYQIDEPASLVDYLRFRDWVAERGGEVPYADDTGALVRSVYLNKCGGDSGERYHKWVAAPALVVHNEETGKFTTCWLRDYDVVEA